LITPEEESTRGGRHDEEIGGCDLADMFVRNVRDVCEGGRRCRGMYVATVA
jgi:hypothetical protein